MTLCKSLIERGFNFAGVALVTFGGLCIWAAIHGTTCNQGDDSFLLIGGLPSTLSYVLGFALLLWKPLPHVLWLLMVPALALVLYLIYWTGRFAYEYFGLSGAACNLVWGNNGVFPRDSGELPMLGWWTSLCVLAVAGTFSAWRCTLGAQLGSGLHSSKGTTR
ncbi:MAG: hypothetical protein WDN72_06985 [Alphaproteobacteria bacterium]